MTDVREEPGDRMIRIAVIGNSNSAMRDSFAAVLGRDKDFSVENLSIGATPNVLLLDVLATTDVLNHDFIIVETAVVDALQVASGAYPMEIARSNLRLFIEVLSTKSFAKLIFLILPTRIALLEPNSHKVEDMYISIAEEYGVPVLNIYDLFRQMIGGYSRNGTQRLSEWAPVVAEAFGIPRHVAYDLSWSALRKPRLPSNSFAMSGFNANIHMSRSMHRLVGNLLADWIRRSSSGQRSSGAPAKPAAILASVPTVVGQEWITRESSLTKRRLLSLAEGGTATYECPNGYIAAGLFLNRSQTTCFIKLESAAGSVVLDCRFIPYSLPWVGLVVPIIDPVGDGDITLTVCGHEDATTPVRRLPDTRDDACVTASAEIAEIVLIKQGLAIASESERSEAARYGVDLSIQRFVSSRTICERAFEAVDSIIDGVGEIGFGFSRGLAAEFMQLVNKGPVGVEASDRARLLLLTGNAATALQLLTDSIASGNSDPALLHMRQTLTAFLETVHEGA
jgi:hypothetical protein